MESKKMIDIVRVQRMMKKWKKLATAPKSNNKMSINNFLKRTLSLTNTSSSSSSGSFVPKGYLALCVGDEMRRFVIPTDYLGYAAFAALLREAEEEFGFEQEGVLRIPCHVSVFEAVLKAVEMEKGGSWFCSTDAEFSRHFRSHDPMCR